MKKENKGVTLIALIITIIVLLILAGITIAMVVGDNGIIAKSQMAKDKTNESQTFEENRLADYENKIETLGRATDSNCTFETGEGYIAKKYDNGIMELYGTYSSTMTTNAAWGSGYNAPLNTITFPISFINTPYVIPVLSRTGSGNVFSLSLENTYNDKFTFYPFSMGPAVTNAPYRVDYVAIGKWK